MKENTGNKRAEFSRLFFDEETITVRFTYLLKR